MAALKRTEELLAVEKKEMIELGDAHKLEVDKLSSSLKEAIEKLKLQQDECTRAHDRVSTVLKVSV